MADLTPETEDAFESASAALQSGSLSMATANEAATYGSEAVVNALRGVCFELAALREAVESRGNILKDGAAE